MRRLSLTVVPALVLVLAVTFVAPRFGTTSEVKLDVPYVPTPEAVVDEMLKVANFRETNILYDLGSGDGRIVIAAAQRYGAHGVGIEIDPARIRESTENARRAGVAHLVRFVQGDIFEANFREATVVTMYLQPDVNMRIRPRLLGELRPGTRIVSHNYDLGDWTPQKAISVGAHTVYFWVVPGVGTG